MTEVRLAERRDRVLDVANDAGVVELGEHARLPLEPHQLVGLQGAQDLDRHSLAGVHIPGLEDFSHTAATRQPLELQLAAEDASDRDHESPTNEPGLTC